jgi:hypothetical protein
MRIVASVLTNSKKFIEYGLRHMILCHIQLSHDWSCDLKVDTWYAFYHVVLIVKRHVIYRVLRKIPRFLSLTNVVEPRKLGLG